MTIMTHIRWQLRLENLQQALARLTEACSQTEYSNLELAGLVQTYGFTFELCWKTLKDLLTFEGYEVYSPRETIRKAFEISLISNVDSWFNALESRNVLSHIYNESAAKHAEHLIKTEFTPMLQECVAALRERAEKK